MVTNETMYDSAVLMKDTRVIRILLIDGDQWKAEKTWTDQWPEIFLKTDKVGLIRVHSLKLSYRPPLTGKTVIAYCEALNKRGTYLVMKRDIFSYICIEIYYDPSSEPPSQGQLETKQNYPQNIIKDFPLSRW